MAKKIVRSRRVDPLCDVISCISNGELEELKSKLKLEPTRTLFKERILSDRLPKDQSPLVVTVLEDQLEIFKYILDNFRTNLEQETSAVIDGDYSQTTLLDVAGESRGRYPVEGATPLWTASTLGRVPFVKLLVSRGADIEHATDSKSTPLRGAAFDGHCEVCEFLVHQGADIDKPNQVGQSPLTIAAAMRKKECVKLLIAKDANVNYKGHNGDTPLHVSVESGDVEIAEILVKAGARNTPNDVGFTPAILACCYGHSEVMEFLDKTFHLEPKERYDCYCLLAAKDILSSTMDSNAEKWMKKAVAIRQKYSDVFKHLAPADSVYDGLKEPLTEAEVVTILQDETSMFFISSIYCERILGKIHPTTAFYIRISGDIALAESRYSKCIELWHRSLEFDDAARMAYELQITEDLLFAIRGFSIMADNHFTPPVEPHFQWGLKEYKMAHESKISETDIISCLCRMIASWIKVAEGIEDNKEREEANECILRSVKSLISIMEGNSCPVLIACLQNLPEHSSGAWKDITCAHLPLNRVVALFLDQGCSVHCEDEDGNFPLHLAVQMKDDSALECIRTLLEYGAHIDAVNFDGLTALDVAKTKGIGCKQKPTEIMSELEAAMFHYSSLQCLASKAVTKYKIDYALILPRQMVEYVSWHEGEKRN